MTHSIQYEISFGDCDPAGIVFYPNTYRWMDRCFHDLLRRHGGHEALCKRLGAIGVGLRSASAKFLRPMRDGDDLTIQIERIEWEPKTLTLHYVGTVRGAPVFTGQEARALLVVTSAGMKSGDLTDLKGLIEGNGDGK